MKSYDSFENNVERIAALFPHCVTECRDMSPTCKNGKTSCQNNETSRSDVPTMRYKIDFDKLRAELSNDILEDSEERYQFTWPDKRAASRLANEATTKTHSNTEITAE